jgi:hypothetical protein
MSVTAPIHARVRLKGDPSRICFLTGGQCQRREQTLRQIKFPDTTSWVPDDQVEPVPVERERPLDLLRAGKLSRAEDLRRALTHVRLTGRLADVIYSMETTNTDFYQCIIVERPLRLNFAVDDEHLARLQEAKPFINLATSKKRKDTKADQAEIEVGRKQQEAILAVLRTFAGHGVMIRTGEAHHQECTS